jgi:hypothetical protein
MEVTVNSKDETLKTFVWFRPRIRPLISFTEAPHPKTTTASSLLVPYTSFSLCGRYGTCSLPVQGEGGRGAGRAKYDTKKSEPLLI